MTFSYCLQGFAANNQQENETLSLKTTHTQKNFTNELVLEVDHSLINPHETKDPADTLDTVL